MLFRSFSTHCLTLFIKKDQYCTHKFKKSDHFENILIMQKQFHAHCFFWRIFTFGCDVLKNFMRLETETHWKQKNYVLFRNMLFPNSSSDNKQHSCFSTLSPPSLGEMEETICMLERGTIITKYYPRRRPEQKTLMLRRETRQVSH